MMTAEQLAETRTYDSLEPIGGVREDYRTAYICLMLHNLMQMQRGDGKWDRRTIKDFLLWGPKTWGQGQTDKPQPVETMKAVLMSIPGVRIKKGKAD